MKSKDLPKAHERTQLSNNFVPAVRSADIIASRKKVGRIKADTQSLGVMYLIEDFGKMFELVTQAGSLPSCVLQRDPYRCFSGSPENFVQGCNDALQPSLLAGA